MNKRVHRLVFDRRRGMRVPAAEHVRSSGKAAGGQTRAVALACAMLLTAGVADQAEAQNRTLTSVVPRASGVMRSNPGSPLPVFSTDKKYTDFNFGSFNAPVKSADGLEMTINQTDRLVIINWDSFNIDKGYTVTFKQPTNGTALNHIHDTNPSVIMGKLQSNGEIILENTNGVVFGSTARVDAGKLIVTALKVADDTYKAGLRNFGATQQNRVSFGDDKSNPNGIVSVEAGAEIRSLAGGEVMLIAPKVLNEGLIETPNGQAILAAGQKVYLYATTNDASQRGLIVAADAFTGEGQPEGTGVAENLGKVFAEQGTINMVGAAIRQRGVLTATTAVKGQNGAIYLQAHTSTMGGSGASNEVRVGKDLGTIELGEGSVTSVLPSTALVKDPETGKMVEATQTASETFYRSRIAMEGRDIHLKSGAQVVAPSGVVSIRAAETRNKGVFTNDYVGGGNYLADSSRIVIDDNVVIDVSGVSGVSLDASRHQLTGRLFSSELSDSPLQRGGVLYRNTFFSDARRAVNVANVTGFYSQIQRSASELSTAGGIVQLVSNGALIADPSASIKFAGGSSIYKAGTIVSSLLRRDAQYVRIEGAKAGEQYDELMTGGAETGLLSSVPEITVGDNAGAAVVAAPYLSMPAKLDGSVVLGEAQRTSGQSQGDYINFFGNIDQVELDSIFLTRKSATILSTSPNLYTSLRPLGGWLMVGKQFGNNVDQQLLSGVDVVASGVAGVAAPTDWDNTDAWAQTRAQIGRTATLSADALNASGIGRLDLLAGQVRVGTAGAPVNLNLHAAAQVNVASTAIELNGNIRAAGGEVKMTVVKGDETPGDITIAQGSSIDVSGALLDERVRTPDANEAVVTSGGKVTLSAERSIVLDGGIDVSGGAWRAGSGALTQGSAGSVTMLINTQANASRLPVGRVQGSLAGVKGYDFKSGGKFTLKGVNALNLSGRNTDPLGLDVSLEALAEQGFGTMDLGSLGHVEIAAGSFIRPELKNWVLTPSRVGALTDKGMVYASKLETGLRQGVSVSLTAAQVANAKGQALPGLEDGANITVGKNAELDVGIGGAINLAAGGRIDVDGKLRARAGQVSAVILGERGGTATEAGNSPDAAGWKPDQLIHLKANAEIDVSGVVKSYMPDGDNPAIDNARERVVGEVLAGGTVSLGAKADKGRVRGRVITEEGSKILLNGVKGELDRGRTVNKSTLYAGAGTLNVVSTDGFALLGSVEAKAPDASVSGGQLNVSVSREGANDLVQAGEAYTAQSHTVRVVNTKGELATELGLTEKSRTIDQSKLVAGEGVLSSTQMVDAGFDRISLRADDQVVLDKGAHIKRADDQAQLRSVILNTPIVRAKDGDTGDHQIRAHYVSLGDRDLVHTESTLYPEAKGANKGLAGTANLDVRAGLIEVHGHTALQGFDASTLRATLSADNNLLAERRDGEIRFVGRTPTTVNKVSSALESVFSYSGQLDLVAGQVYATTLTKASITGYDGVAAVKDVNDGVDLRIKAPTAGSTSQMPLSALGSMSLTADDIEVDGVLRQPFGEIRLTANNSLTLSDRAEFSVTGAGLQVPVGRIVNKKTWEYSTQGSPTDDAVDLKNIPLDAIQQLTAGLPTEKSVTLTGKTVKIASQAALNAQAGGDLLGWEFISGTGGTTDTLNRPNVFAVLPSYTYDFAPYDTEIMATTQAVGTSLKAGDKVTITSSNGVLATGSYTLLPARYAILPGAVLVSEAKLNTTAPLAQGSLADDGSWTVSGYKSAVGTGINGGNDARLGLVLEPEATFRKKSEIVVTSINSFLDGRTGADGVTELARPGDAGRVSLWSAANFDWQARFNLQGANGFLGGQFDLSMDKMAVMADPNEAAAAGDARISLDALNATGADSIVLGGIRSGTAASATVDVKASEVKWVAAKAAPDASAQEQARVARLNALQTPGDVLSVATSSVSVDDGMTLASTGRDTQSARVYKVTGKGAALLVGSVQNTDLQRTLTAAAAKGDLKVGKATLQGAALQLDATGVFDLDSSAKLNTGSIGLGAQSMVLGGAAPKAASSTLVLTGTALDAVSQTAQVQLRAYSSIDLVDDVTLGARDASTQQARINKLTLDAPQLRGVSSNKDQTGLTAQVLARDITLRNTSGLAADATAAAGTNKLVMTAEPAKADGRTGGITLGAQANGAGQTLAFVQTTLSSKGDVVTRGTGTVTAQGDMTIESARLTAASDANYTLNAKGDLVINKRSDARTLDESVGVGGQLTLSGARVAQNGVVDIESGTLKITGKGTAGQTDTVVLGEGSTTSVKGRSHAVSDTWTVATPGGRVDITAEKGDVVLAGLIDASAPALAAKDDGTPPAAGAVTISAVGAAEKDKFDQGRVRLGENARINLEAGRAGQSGLGGSLAVDAGQLVKEPGAQGLAADGSALDRLATMVATRNGNAHDAVTVRVRSGDQVLHNTVKAERVVLTADTGSVTVATGGTIDARALAGGVIQLNAGKDVVLQGGSTLQADSSRAGANGGDILLNSLGLVDETTKEAGRVKIGSKDASTGEISKATITAASADDALDGRVVIRARRDDSATTEAGKLNVDAVYADIQAGQVDVEAVRVYKSDTRTQLVTGDHTATAWGLKSINSDNSAFLSDANKTALLSAMNLGGMANVHLKSGVEIQTTKDFTFGQDINLYSDTRPGGEPMYLTVRAGGNINVNANISDGFATATRAAASATAPTAVKAGDATSYRFVAGADLNSADTLAYGGEKKNLTVAGGKLIRTTAGSIDLVASGNIDLLATGTTSSATVEQASVYVAGRLAGLADGETMPYNYTWGQFTERGGRLTATAGQNITQAAPAQMIGNWFYHGGDSASEVAWWSAFDSFRQGFGSFGGGNIDVAAKGSIRNIGVVAPTSARTLTSAGGKSSLKVFNGGDITVSAGQDVAGGIYFLGRGEGRITAGGALALGDGRKSGAKTVSPSGAYLGLMDGRWAVQTNGDLNVATVYNPTMMSNPAKRLSEARNVEEAAALAAAGSYLTYGEGSGVSLTSLRGNTNWASAPVGTSDTFAVLHGAFSSVANELIDFSSNTTYGASSATLPWANVAPPVVRITSVEGDVNLSNSGKIGDAIRIMQSPQADLSVYAGRDLNVNARVHVLDGGAVEPNSVKNPAYKLANSSLDLGSLNRVFDNSPVDGSTNSSYPSRYYQNNKDLITIHAERDITFGTPATSALALPRAASITAGEDINGLNFRGQHFSADDVTTIQAGGNIGGYAKSLTAEVSIAGPGQLRVEAGKDLDLGISKGILATGSVRNTALPDAGAKVLVAAGMSQQVNLPQAVTNWGEDAAFRAAVVDAVSSKLDLPAGAQSWSEVSWAEVQRLFQTLQNSTQVGVLNQYLNQRFVAAYLPELAGKTDAYYRSTEYEKLKREKVWSLVQETGAKAVAIAASTDAAEEARRAQLRAALWADLARTMDLAGLGNSFNRQGSIDLAASKVHTLAHGDFTTGGIDVMSLGGGVLAGLNKAADANNPLGIITRDGGSIRAYSKGDFLVNGQKTMVVGAGDLLIYTSDGSIDSGKGSNTAVSAGGGRRLFDADLNQVVLKPAVPTTGSGIQIARNAQGVSTGLIKLYTPNGEIRALDAYIKGGDGIQAAGPVKGGDNLIVPGNPQPSPEPAQVNVTPPPTSPQAGVEEAADGSKAEKTAKQNNAILTVELLGLGDEALDDAEAPAAGKPGEDKKKDCKKDESSSVKPCP